MSSFIPKISIGQASHRNKFDLSANTHTTSEIGYCQPMYCQFLDPKTTLQMKQSSLVRLSSLFVPTMGKIELRNYHAFVPLNTLWTQWDAYITGTDYTIADGTSYRPERVPMMSIAKFFYEFTKHRDTGFNSNVLISTNTGGDHYLGVATYSDIFSVYGDSAAANLKIVMDNDPEFCNFGYYFGGKYNGFIIKNDNAGKTATSIQTDYLYVWNNSGTLIFNPAEEGSEMKGTPASSNSDPAKDTITFVMPTREAHDFVGNFASHVDGSSLFNNSFAFYTLYGTQMRRLRKAFIGLGYQFNPYIKTELNIFPFLAYYKAWYHLFYPQRESNFYATNCYRIIKYFSERAITSDIFSYGVDGEILDFFLDVRDMRYILPLDYFSLADPKAETRGITTGTPGTNGYNVYNTLTVNGGSADNDHDYLAQANFYSRVSDDPAPDSIVDAAPYVNDNGGAEISALSIRTAMKLMRFVNKNTVIGKKVSDILQARFGVIDEHEKTHERVYVIGRSSVNVQISDVMSQSDTSSQGGLALGDYAGKGVGFNESKTFSFSNGAEHGVFLSFSMVVPIMSYYQGISRANLIGGTDRFEWFSPEYDALGYDDVKAIELNAQIQEDVVPGFWSMLNPEGKSLGYVPRYSSLKIKNDIVNGDISLPSRWDSMSPYALVRHFSGIPNMSPENFRSIDVTDFNRIFNSKSSWDDHFIIQSYFDVSAWCDKRSLATSFDTFDEDGDTRSSDFEHQ
jgi:hypothetical protein